MQATTNIAKRREQRGRGVLCHEALLGELEQWREVAVRIGRELEDVVRLAQLLLEYVMLRA